MMACRDWVNDLFEPCKLFSNAGYYGADDHTGWRSCVWAQQATNACLRGQCAGVIDPNITTTTVFLFHDAVLKKTLMRWV